MAKTTELHVYCIVSFSFKLVRNFERKNFHFDTHLILALTNSSPFLLLKSYKKKKIKMIVKKKFVICSGWDVHRDVTDISLE